MFQKFQRVRVGKGKISRRKNMKIFAGQKRLIRKK
jgi:hypothetical protein